MRNAPHRLMIVRRTVTDHEGAAAYEWADASPVWGRFSWLDASELPEWEGQEVTACARVPLSTDVRNADRLRAIYPMHPAVPLSWEIVTVRWTPAHLRLMLRSVAQS